MKLFYRLIAFILAITIVFSFADTKVIAEEITVSAKSAILINAKTGEVLFAKNENERRAMASTTKIMTALLTLEAGDLDKTFTVDNYAIHVEGTTMGLQEGDIVTRRALAQGMLLPSANDGANAAAVNIAGSIPKFATMMNEKAKSLGLNDTQYVTPSGLDADGHYSTASDLAKLAAYALQNEEFAKICSQTNIKTTYGKPNQVRWLKNSNKMLTMYDGAIGVKTGFTDNARRCLVSAAERDGITLIAVTLNAPDDWQDHTKMLDMGFSMYEKVNVSFDEADISIPVVGGEVDSVPVVSNSDLQVFVQKTKKDNLRARIVTTPFLYAGIKKGDEVARVEFLSDSHVVGDFPLMASADVGIKENKGFFDWLFGLFG